MSIKLTDKIESVAKAGIIVDALQVSGGYIVVDSSLNEIKQETIKIGTKAYIATEDKEYRYTLNGWKECLYNQSVGIQTFETYSAMEQALPTLSRGQIVTLVNSTTTEAYIANYNCTQLIKIEGNVQELSEIDSETLLNIFDGTFVPDEIWPSNAVQKSSINEILTGSFEESGIPSSGIQKDTIDSIVNGGYQA